MQVGNLQGSEMILTQKARLLGNEASREKRSKAEDVAWALKGGPKRKKEMKLTAMHGVWEGRKLAVSLAAKMSKAGLKPSDAVVSLAFTDAKGKLHAPVETFRYPDAHADSEDLQAARRH